jgi:hypothetical protein
MDLPIRDLRSALAMPARREIEAVRQLWRVGGRTGFRSRIKPLASTPLIHMQDFQDFDFRALHLQAGGGRGWGCAAFEAFSL